jgi:hypothetical protein
MIYNNKNNDMEKELIKLISDKKFIDFLNDTSYIGYIVTYNKMKFIIILN